MLKRMTLYISTGDGVIEHGAVDLYWGQCGGVYDGPDLKLFILVGWGRSFLSVAWPTGVQLMFFFSSGVSKLFGAQGSPSSGSLLNLRVLVFDSSGCLS